MTNRNTEYFRNSIFILFIQNIIFYIICLIKSLKFLSNLHYIMSFEKIILKFKKYIDIFILYKDI